MSGSVTRARYIHGVMKPEDDPLFFGADYRWLWWDWRRGEVAFVEARYYAQRFAFEDRLADRFHLPLWLRRMIVWWYDVLYESDALSNDPERKEEEPPEGALEH